jgi:glutamate-ammonia-ligase adenylyltransferase
LGQTRNEVELAAEVLQMRQKMREHLLPADTSAAGTFHLKQGIGGIVDIEFMVQYAVLAWSNTYPQLGTWPDNIRILEALARAGLFSEAESQSLIEAYISYRSVAHQQALQQQPGVVDGAEFTSERLAVSSKWAQLLESKIDDGD